MTKTGTLKRARTARENWPDAPEEGDGLKVLISGTSDGKETGKRPVQRQLHLA